MVASATTVVELERALSDLFQRWAARGHPHPRIQQAYRDGRVDAVSLVVQYPGQPADERRLRSIGELGEDALEYLAIDPRFQGLFGPEVRQVAADNLRRAGLVVADAPTRQDARTLDPDEFTSDWTTLAGLGRLEPVWERAKEVELVAQHLNRAVDRGALVFGDRGTGVGAILRGVAHRQLKEERPWHLKEIRLSRLLSQGARPDDVGRALNQVFDDAAHEGRTAIVFRAVDQLVEGDRRAAIAESGRQALRAALEADRAPIICATSSRAALAAIRRDEALSDRLRRITIEPLGPRPSLRVLEATRAGLERRYSVEIEDDALDSAIRLADRHVKDIAMPGAAMRILQDACESAEAASFAGSVDPEEVTRAQDTVNAAGGALRLAVSASDDEDVLESAGVLLKRELLSYEQAIEAGDLDRAAEIRYGPAELFEAVMPQGTSMDSPQPSAIGVVDGAAMSVAASQRTGIPVNYLDIGNRSRVRRLREILSQRIVGQPEAVDVVYAQLLIAQAGFHTARRPIANLLFAGPTGVGKTETARVIAEIVCGSERDIVRLDMTEYESPQNVTRLTGSAPGYVGHNEGGQLTEAVRQKPYAVVLLDEIEKACREVRMVLLQVMDDGRLTDGSGRTVDFTHTVLVMTTNAPPEEIETKFEPEWRNRLDGIVSFEHLERRHIALLVDRTVETECRAARDKGISVVLSDEARDLLAARGYDRDLGARPLRRVVHQQVLLPLVELWRDERVRPNSRVRVDVDQARLRLAEDPDTGQQSPETSDPGRSISREWISCGTDAERQAMPVLRDALHAASGRMDVGQHRAAVRALTERLAWYEIDRTLAELAAAEERTDDAMAHYRSAVSAAPNQAELAIHFGRFLLDVVKDKEGAIEEFRRAVSLQPGWVASRLELCRAYVYNRQPSRARSILAPVWHHREELPEFRNSIYARRLEVLVLEAQHFARIAKWRDSMVAATATRGVVEESHGHEVSSVRKDLAYLDVPVHGAAESGDPVAERAAGELKAWFRELALDDGA